MKLTLIIWNIPITYYTKMSVKVLFAAMWLGLLAASSCVAEDSKVVCYYGSWAVYRPGRGKFSVEDINPSLCTHVIYAFAGLDSTTSEIKVLDPWNDLPDNYGKNAYGRFTGLKSQNPNLKTMLAIGGWNEGSVKYSKMASSSTTRSIFIKSVIKLMQENGFDGFDLDWEYPSNRGGSPQDKKNFALLVKELRKEFNSHGFLLSAAVGVGSDKIDTAYDVPALAQNLDFINLMTYDLHGSWESTSGHHTALRPTPEEVGNQRKLNLEWAVNRWIQLGAPAEKLVLGLASYGRTFTLLSSSKAGLGAPTTGPGSRGPLTRESGFLGYNEICSSTEGWKKTVNPLVGAPYASKGNQWVGYDDLESIKMKSQWGKSLGLGGAMLWSIETDDFHGLCGQGKFPILHTINAIWREGKPVVVRPTTGKPVSSTTTTTYPAPITTTITPSTTTTTVTDGDTQDCMDNGYMRDQRNCGKFYQCYQISEGWSKAALYCPEGLVFNTEGLYCDWPENVPECSSSIPY
ncbi:unnamed protein product [Meganyctiphanes norvegica]|uniref:Chitinase n=1 Tax=Meganyctiphanes norvegica TaxID=48144 RepID=A0AAV2QSZ2_MEGNR